MNYELLRAVTVGESVAQDEQVLGLAVDMDGPVTQEAIDIVQEAAFILASVNSFPNPTSPDSQDGETPRKGMIS